MWEALCLTKSISRDNFQDNGIQDAVIFTIFIKRKHLSGTTAHFKKTYVYAFNKISYCNKMLADTSDC